MSEISIQLLFVLVQKQSIVNLYNLIPTTDVRSTLFDKTGKHTALTLPSTYSNFHIQVKNFYRSVQVIVDVMFLICV